jgi:hypothetical protein
MSEEFDPESLRLSPEIAAEIGKKPAGRQGSKQQKRTDPFLQIPHRAIVRGAKVLGGRRLLVWLYIHHRVWADKRQTVTIGNQTLGAWGVSRKEKYTALRKLAGAGLIEVEWRERKSPLVTLAH